MVRTVAAINSLIPISVLVRVSIAVINTKTKSYMGGGNSLFNLTAYSPPSRRIRAGTDAEAMEGTAP